MDENKDIKSTSLGYLEERELGNIKLKQYHIILQRINIFKRERDLDRKINIKRKVDLNYKKINNKISTG